MVIKNTLPATGILPPGALREANKQDGRIDAQPALAALVSQLLKHYQSDGRAKQGHVAYCAQLLLAQNDLLKADRSKEEKLLVEAILYAAANSNAIANIVERGESVTEEAELAAVNLP